MVRFMWVVSLIMLAPYTSIQPCIGNTNFPSYGLCDVGDVITSFNGSIVRNDGSNCTRVILGPLGYRIKVTVHENNLVRGDASLILHDGGALRADYQPHNSRKLLPDHIYGVRTFTSSSNAILIHIDKLTRQTTLNISFVIFRQSSERCQCLPVTNGKAVCTLRSGFSWRAVDDLKRRCDLQCNKGYYSSNVQRLAAGHVFGFECSLNHTKHEDEWTKMHDDDMFEDKREITCSKPNPVRRIELHISFSYNNISCKHVDLKYIEQKLRGHIVNRTSVPSVGECFKSEELEKNRNCVVESLNVSCSSIRNGTASRMKLLIQENIILSDANNHTTSAQEKYVLYGALRNNVSQSLKLFISKNLVLNGTYATDVTEQTPSYFCPGNEVYGFIFTQFHYIQACRNCSKHFYRIRSDQFDKCKRCPNGTHREINEESCVRGVQDYPKPSLKYCEHACDLGKFFNANSSLCEWCPYGTYQNLTGVVNPVCQNCPDGKTTGFVGARNIFECIHLCPAGQYLKFTSCIMCGVGFFMPNESNRLHKCYQCPTGYTTLDTGTKNVSGCVQKCTTGQYFNTTVGACLFCPNNTYQDEVADVNTRSCKSCPENSATANVGSKSLSDCLGNCSTGQYIDIKNKKCSPCPLNTYHDATQHLSFTCKPCGEYKITQNIGSTNMSDCIHTCRKGEFFNTTSKICEKCEVNTYQDRVGKDSCKSCPGKTFTLRRGVEQCISPCNYGQLLNKSAEQCQDCPSGYYQNMSDYTSDACFPCPLDFYNDQTGRHNCTVCPDQKITVIPAAKSLSECIDTCKPGTFLNKSRKECHECLKGSYQGQNQYRLEHCTNCPLANLTTLGTGAASLEQCVGYCASSPCHNGGECVNIDNGFKCTCPKHLEGKRCEIISDGNSTDVIEISVRFPDLVWNEQLSSPGSKEFMELARKVEKSVREELQSDATFRTVKVQKFSRRSVISELNVNYVAGTNFRTPVDTLSSAMADGKLGNLTADNSSLKIVNFTCTQPLGMENGRIPDKAITSNKQWLAHPPQNARLNSLKPGWASSILSGVYLQVDFGEEVILTGIATQGSSYRGGSWLRSYYFQHSSDGREWRYYAAEHPPYDIFVGNNDVNSTVRNELKSAVKTRYIRIFEYTFEEWISYRIEFYGCPIPGDVPLPTQTPPATTITTQTTVVTKSVATPTFQTTLTPQTTMTPKSVATPTFQTTLTPQSTMTPKSVATPTFQTTLTPQTTITPNSASSTTPVSVDDGDSGSNVGLIVGLVVGIGALFLLIVVIGILWVKKRTHSSYGFAHGSTVDIIELKEDPSM